MGFPNTVSATLLLICSHIALGHAVDSCSIDPNAYSCSLCLQLPGCVWCEQNGRCVSDNSTAAQTCVASQLITLHTPSKCPTCSNYMTCSDCMSARYGDCGWCAQNNSCISNAILSDGTACPASSYTSSKQGWPACPVPGFAEGLLSARDLTVFLPNDLGVVSLTNMQALDDSRVFRLQIPNSNRMLHLNIGGSAGRCHGEAYYAIITGDDKTPFCIGLGLAVPSRDGSLRPVFNMTAVNNEPYGPTPPRASELGGKNQKGALIDMAPACGTAVSLFIACDTEVNDPALTMDLSELANVNPVCGAEFPLSRVLLKGKGGNGCHRYFFNSTNSQVSCTPAHLAVQRDDSTLITCYIFAMDSENREPWWIQDDLHYVGVNAYFNGVQLAGRNITSITLDENKKLFSFSFFANTADMGFYDIYVYMGRPTYDGNGTAPWKLVPGVINSDHIPFNGLPSPSFFVEIGDFPPPYTPSNSSSLPMWARGGIGAGAFILLSGLFLFLILRDHVFLRKFMRIRLRRCCCCCRCCVKHLYRPNFSEITRPINEVYAFISLCGEDREDIAFPLMYVLEQCGIPTFLDRQFGMCGEDNVDAISNAMYSARFFIPIISDKLLACGRRWPFEEMYQAKQRSHQDYRIYPFVHGLSRKELDTGLKGSGMLRNHIGSVNKSMSPMDSVLKAVPHILAQIYNFEVTSGRNSLSRCPTLCSRRIASAAARWRLGLEEQTHADLGASPPNLFDVPRKPGYQLIPVAEEPQAEQVPLDRHPEYKITRFPVRPEIKNNVNDEDEKTEFEAASPRRTEINNTFQCFQRNHIREYRLLFRSEQKNLEAQDKDIPPVRTVVFKPSSDELMNWYKAAVAEAVCTRLDPTGRLRIDSLE